MPSLVEISPAVLEKIFKFVNVFSLFRYYLQDSNIMVQVKTGVRQGCVMSSFLFNLAIDWVMRKATEDEKRGIRWKINTILEDLDFADDIALLSHTFQHIQ